MKLSLIPIVIGFFAVQLLHAQTAPSTQPVEVPDPTPAVTPGTMVLIHSKQQSFIMGFAEPVKAWAIYAPAHKVTFSYDFELDATLVTQKEYRDLIGVNPAKHPGDGNLPVEGVSWMDAVRYCNALSEKKGLPKAYTFKDPDDAATCICDIKSSGFRLPTNSELEYATRAGTTTTYFFGNLQDIAKSSDYSWWRGNSTHTHAVATKKPNPFGLYDMVGNLFEWANDWEGTYPSGEVTDPTGPPTGKMKIAKGGSVRNDIEGHQRTCYHYRWDPTVHHWEVGFRVARTVN